MNTKLYQLTRDIAFTLTTLRAKESILTPHLLEQMAVVDGFHARYEELKKKIKIVTLDRRTTDDRIHSIIEDATQLLKEISFRVKTDRSDRYKKYFPVCYSTAIKKDKSLLKAYEVVRSEINLETDPSILAFKERVEAIYEVLFAETTLITDTKADHKFLQQEIDKLYDDWKLEYKRLKLVVKSVLLGKEMTYKLFFETKDTKKSSPKESVDDTNTTLPSSITTPILDN